MLTESGVQCVMDKKYDNYYRKQYQNCLQQLNQKVKESDVFKENFLQY